MPSNRPLPTNLKALRGTARPCRLNENEPRPVKLISIEPPDLLTDPEKECWRSVITGLQDAGIVTCIDVSSLVSYCQSWVGWIDANKQLQKEGSVIENSAGNKIVNPVFKVANENFKRLLQLWREFGMTPSSRTRINATVDKPEDDFDAWQKRRRMSKEGV